ncbi:OLC1v1000250C1 [Oldenlandia corymbosa var. corymbosa]|uniref:OLC1v1000250C1 n=1 Tax=Oldenlandia corymbosa var. corymbosa TaxID=529605 RepID=A0AAV1D5Y4_OLDCO|nr:OLC1v1000250C1 [Oldenlandia corymbosa var. corymbosa]
MFNETDDMQISTDWFNGRPRGTDNQINTGFYHDLITEGSIIKELGLIVRFLDTIYFSGFCANSKDIRKVATVHANCCRSIVAKVADLTRVLRDWEASKKFIRNPAANYSEFKWSSHSDCKKSWKDPPPNLI